MLKKDRRRGIRGGATLKIRKTYGQAEEEEEQEEMENTVRVVVTCQFHTCSPHKSEFIIVTRF
jgi:hypothetical protein